MSFYNLRMTPLTLKYQCQKSVHCLLLGLLITTLLALAACNMSRKEPDAGQYFSTPLALEMALAIKNSDIKSIKALAKKIDINTRGNKGMTFLLWAMKNAEMPAFKTLLSLGADPDAGTDEGTFPLEIAIMAEDFQWLKLLVEAGADVNLKDGGEPIWFGTYLANNWKALDYLLQHGVDVNATDSTGYTAIMDMAGFGDYDQVLKLLQKGADVSVVSKGGVSFAYIVQTRVPVKTHKQHQYFQQVVKHLQSKGIVLPVKGPRD